MAMVRLVNGATVMRTACGAGIGAAAQHSQCYSAWYAHCPGLKVIAPSNAADAKGLLKAAIRDDNPVMFLEHKLLYLGQAEPVPEQPYAIPLGKAAIRRPGQDVTIVATQMMVQQALTAATRLEEALLAADMGLPAVREAREVLEVWWEAQGARVGRMERQRSLWLRAIEGIAFQPVLHHDGLVQFVHEYRARASQLVHHESVVNDFVAYVNRCAEQVQGALHDFNGAIYTGAEPPGIGKQDIHQSFARLFLAGVNKSPSISNRMTPQVIAESARLNAGQCQSR